MSARSCPSLPCGPMLALACSASRCDCQQERRPRDMPPSDAEATVPSSRKIALVTGITGQDGSYLAELLLSKGYEVHGLIRRASTFNTERLDRIYQDPHDSDVRLRLHYGDLHDGVGLVNLLYAVQPDEVYHLGAQSHVKVSF